MTERKKAPLWFSVTIMLGLLWNVFGVIQFLGGMGRTADDYVSQGMTAAQAALMANQPRWLEAAFALGVLFGVIGCIRVLQRAQGGVVRFALSVVALCVMIAGNAAYGLFAVMGPERLATMLFTLMVALILLGCAAYARRHDIIP
ncbi:hypothetical protein LGQ03_12015 [Loktanella sp. TSTF-M6]|uniref:Uncharacterized protein n=1 Tax=Loktanella gaetbuli TaxID=2881335 RepID=A0ABS8BW69_9RHOB|nr:hypothetical protein [Loktanella gaetbuli]MCB5199965.1 hypothetical protein [Loktanella gaetbuli]